MEFTMSRHVAKEIVRELGFDGFLKILQLRFPNLGLYTVSGTWFRDRSKSCVVKGMRCDLSISLVDMGAIKQPYTDLVGALLRKGELSEVARLLQPLEFLAFFERTTGAQAREIRKESQSIRGDAVIEHGMSVYTVVIVNQMYTPGASVIDPKLEYIRGFPRVQKSSRI